MEGGQQLPPAAVASRATGLLAAGSRKQLMSLRDSSSGSQGQKLDRRASAPIVTLDDLYQEIVRREQQEVVQMHQALPLQATLSGLSSQSGGTRNSVVGAATISGGNNSYVLPSSPQTRPLAAPAVVTTTPRLNSTLEYLAQIILSLLSSQSGGTRNSAVGASSLSSGNSSYGLSHSAQARPLAAPAVVATSPNLKSPWRTSCCVQQEYWPETTNKKRSRQDILEAEEQHLSKSNRDDKHKAAELLAPSVLSKPLLDQQGICSCLVPLVG